MAEPVEPRTAPPPERVLVVDDEKNIRATLSVCLEGMGAEVVAVATGEAALAALEQRPFDLAFLDLRLAEQSGLDLIPGLLAACPGLRIVVITAFATIDSAVEAIRRGAGDYLPKPFTPAQIRRLVEQDIERRALRNQVADLSSRLAEAAPEIDLETGSARMRAVLAALDRAAAADVTVLLRGESGTGKGALARALHGRSRRNGGPWVVVSCPTLTDELLSSELFGHARGAFTGAVRDQPGRVEAAEGGTLFLDEVGDLSPALQAKLLRFLQDREFERLGESRTRHADVRVVAATNRDLAEAPFADRRLEVAVGRRHLEAAVREGRFREDLLYRLNVVELTVPPLRERREDIPRLAARFLAFFARAALRPALELAPAVEQIFLSYPWPGNVRELRNVLERVSILWPSAVVEPEALPERMLAHVAPRPRVGGDFTLAQVEQEHVLQVLARSRSQEEAARILGIDVSTLWRKRKRLGEP